MKVDHFKVVSSNERLNEIDNLVDDWIAVDDVDLSDVNWVSLLRIFHVESHSRYNDFR